MQVQLVSQTFITDYLYYHHATDAAFFSPTFMRNQPPVGDPNNLQWGGPGRVRHEAEGQVTDATRTTELEIV